MQMTSEKIELLPCPFCGAEGESLIDVVSIGEMIHIVRCFECGAQSGRCVTAEKAKATWNHREDPDGLPYWDLEAMPAKLTCRIKLFPV